MTNDLAQEVPLVTGDPVLLNVLASAQRFAAWYAEFLSAGVQPHDVASKCSNEEEPGGSAACLVPSEDVSTRRLAAEAQVTDLQDQALRRAEEVTCHLQHAVFDLMAAVHEMNSLCAGQSQAEELRRTLPLALMRTALH